MGTPHNAISHMERLNIVLTQHKHSTFNHYFPPKQENKQNL